MKFVIQSILCVLLLGTIQLGAQELKVHDSPQEPQQVMGSLTAIEFQETEFQWGEIVMGEKIQNIYTFRNTGSEPLIITNAKGSCGCTVPRFPKEPIMPGEYGELLVQFDSKNKKGMQAKRVTITTNTDPANTYLTIKGKVLVPGADAPKVKILRNENDFDVASSSVALFPNPTQNELQISLKEFEGESANIEIYNMMGERVLEQSEEAISSSAIRMDVSNFPPGTYSAVMKIGEKNRVAKQFLIAR